jgi:hypothetical protein
MPIACSRLENVARMKMPDMRTHAFAVLLYVSRGLKGMLVDKIQTTSSRPYRESKSSHYAKRQQQRSKQ